MENTLWQQNASGSPVVSMYTRTNAGETVLARVQTSRDFMHHPLSCLHCSRCSALLISLICPLDVLIHLDKRTERRVSDVRKREDEWNLFHSLTHVVSDSRRSSVPACCCCCRCGNMNKSPKCHTTFISSGHSYQQHLRSSLLIRRKKKKRKPLSPQNETYYSWLSERATFQRFPNGRELLPSRCFVLPLPETLKRNDSVGKLFHRYGNFCWFVPSCVWSAETL